MPINIEEMEGIAEDPFTSEMMEKAIVELATAARQLMMSRLKQETIVVLLHDQTKISKRTIRTILENLQTLEETYLKPRPE
jgi:siroheme synthase